MPLASDGGQSARTPPQQRWSPRHQPPFCPPAPQGASLELIAHTVDASQRWTSAHLTDLGLKLAALQYRLPFDAQSADLVERLFGDLMTSVETNKKVMVELRTLKEKNMQLESALRGQMTGKAPREKDAPKLQSRVFRLTRLTESLIFICSQLAGVSAPCDWSNASVSLLSLLLSYEKQLEEGKASVTDDSQPEDAPGVKEFPPFLREFHSVWRAHEERDELQHQLKMKDKEISRLLTETGDALSTLTTTGSSTAPETVEQHETTLLKAVESLRAHLEAKVLDSGTPANAPSLLAELQRWRAQVKALEGEKKTQEEHIRKLEKRFASVLKKQQELDHLYRGVKSASPLGQSSSDEGDIEKAAVSNRKHRSMIRLINEKEIDAFESAKEAWRHERVLLETQREEKERELQHFKRQMAQIEDDMDEASKKYTRVLSQLEKANEALTFARNRIDFFEQGEVERQQILGEQIKRCQELQRELDAMKEVIKAKDEHVAEQGAQMDDISRALVAKDGQLQTALAEQDRLTKRLQQATAEFERVSQMLDRVQLELRNIEEGRDIVSEKLQSQSESLQHQSAEMELLRERIERDNREIEGLKDEIDHLQLTLRKAGEVKHKLETQLAKAASERSAYKESAVEARQSLKSAQDQYASLESRYRTLLLEIDGGESQAENALNASHSSMVWKGDFVAGENVQQQLETLHREVNAFRRSRDQALRQKTIALEKLKHLEAEIRKLESANTALTQSTQVLHKRLRNYSKRIEMLDGIIAQQRNHILSYRMDTVPEDDTKMTPSVASSKVSAAMRYLMARASGGSKLSATTSQLQTALTPVSITTGHSSRPLSDPFYISPGFSTDPIRLSLDKFSQDRSERALDASLLAPIEPQVQPRVTQSRSSTKLNPLGSRHRHVRSLDLPSRLHDPTPYPHKGDGEPITPISGTVPPEASEASSFRSPQQMMWLEEDDCQPSPPADFEAGPSVSVSHAEDTTRREDWSAGPSVPVDRLDATERMDDSIVNVSSSSEGATASEDRLLNRSFMAVQPPGRTVSDLERFPSRESSRKPSRDSTHALGDKHSRDVSRELLHGHSRRQSRELLHAHSRRQSREYSREASRDVTHELRRDSSRESRQQRQPHRKRDLTRADSSPLSLSGSDLYRHQEWERKETAPGYSVDYRDDLDNSDTWRKLEQSQTFSSFEEDGETQNRNARTTDDAEMSREVSRYESYGEQSGFEDESYPPDPFKPYDDEPFVDSAIVDRVARSRVMSTSAASGGNETRHNDHSLMYSASRLSDTELRHPFDVIDLTVSGAEEDTSMWQLSDTSGGKATIDKALSTNWDFSELDTARLTRRTRSIARSDGV